jgi:Domain of unknown function (DUF4384)
MKKEGKTMWRMSWFLTALSILLVTQTWLVYAADGSSQGAKALFYTETGTTVAPKPDERGTTPSPLPQLQVEKDRKDSAGRTFSRTKTASTGTGVSREPWMGIAYWVEWQSPGAAPTRIADPSRFVFRSGDRIRFHVKTNVPGYLYVVNRGSSGRDTMLFPYVGMPDRLNRVEGQKDYAIPPRGWIMFDNQPGEEVLLFAISPNSLTNLLEASSPGSSLSPLASGRLIDVVDRRGAKDLLVETDNTPGQQATYLGAAVRPVTAEPGDSTVVTYTLRLQHQ